MNRAFPYYIDRARDEQALWAFVQGLNNDNNFKVNVKAMQFRTLNDAVSYASNLDHVLKEEKAQFNRNYQNKHMARVVEVDCSDDECECDEDDLDLEMIRKSFDKAGKQFDKIEKKLNSAQNKSRFDKTEKNSRSEVH